MAGIERIVPGTKEWEAFYANHIHRYKKALQYIGPDIKSILDVASGVGYGTKFIANSFPDTKVVGVDYSIEALEQANQYFSADNITYIQDNAEVLNKLNVNDKFDVIISFETFEHLKNPKSFLTAIGERLSDNGKLIISSPNGGRDFDYNIEDWDFHEKEYTFEEAKEMFEDNGFVVKGCYGQCLSELGNLKDQVRKEINRIRSNPFARMGRFIQKLKGANVPDVVLPEMENDFIWKPWGEASDDAFVLLFELEKKE